MFVGHFQLKPSRLSQKFPGLDLMPPPSLIQPALIRDHALDSVACVALDGNYYHEVMSDKSVGSCHYDFSVKCLIMLVSAR